MTKIVQEDLWQSNLETMIVVTTNGSIRRDGSLVMGRGAAKEATRIFPGIDSDCGHAIVKSERVNNGLYRYGFLRIFSKYPFPFGIFQVKYAWMDKADLELIEFSVKCLEEYALQHSLMRIRMNYPGIGNGRLLRKDVEPLLISLPENVTICYKEML